MQIRSLLRFLAVSLLISTGYILLNSQSNPLPNQINPAELSSSSGWSCDDFPCEDDINGFLNRIRVPDGFTVSHIGQFPGQPMQITYGADERLYGTILEKGTRRGAVYAMDNEGLSERVSPRFWSPSGIAFNDNGQLYVSGRLNADSVGAVWRVESDTVANLVVSSLPCCYALDNQPNGMIFDDTGYLYLGVASTSDHGESETEPQPFESAILKINLGFGSIETYADGIRNPYDLAFTDAGQLYATDNGLATGQGDRILQVNEGEFYGFPYWRSRGCPECPPREGREAQEDWILLNPYTLPRGLVVYDGAQFPVNMVDTLFVTLWNGTDYAQRVVWIDPDDPQLNDEDYEAQPFVTGLIRPVDVAVAPDGSLVVADFIYGHVWRISYDTGIGTTAITPDHTAVATSEAPTISPAIATVISNAQNNTQPAPATPTVNGSGLIFATATPSN